MSVLGIRTIIVATDLSDELIPAVQTAARLAQLTEAYLHIVHTTETPVPESRLSEHLRLANITVTPQVEPRVLIGPPGALIVQDALRVNADAIIFGPHRPGRSQLGSTTYRVLLRTQTPCLMLPVRLSLPLRRVLAPLDLSTPTRATLDVALTWTSALRRRDEQAQPTELIALHAAPDAAADGHNAGNLLARAVEAAWRPFRDAVAVEVGTRVVDGAPSRSILSVANEAGVDLIVMGTRGIDPQEAALGSVSLDVVKRARHPVLLVPPDFAPPRAGGAGGALPPHRHKS
jgi:nucleotide-binding universal stress UspA family protein